jgi:PAS domain S-box-containing protein
MDAGSYREAVYEPFADPGADVDAKIDRAPAVGTEYLGVPIGFLTRIDGDVQEVVRATGDHELLQPGETCPLDEARIGIGIADASDPDSPLVYVNEGFERVTGYDADEAIGRNCRFLRGPATDGETVALLRERIDAEESASVELVNYRQDGAPFWNQVRVDPVVDDGDEVTHYLGFQADVAAAGEQIVDTAEGLLELSEQARELERAVSELVATALKHDASTDPWVGTRGSRTSRDDDRPVPVNRFASVTEPTGPVRAAAGRKPTPVWPRRTNRPNRQWVTQSSDC